MAGGSVSQMSARGTAPAALRGDIDGLRALAIVLVVAFHVGLAGFSGGFVGVDVFFVISGFLITRNLVAESDEHGRPALLRFWARRVRRLVPALGLMLIAVLGLAMVILPFVEWQTVASQARAAALYVSNVAFARQSTDYFAPNINTSLFLHTWSLGVEEQFYLVWPVLVAGVCLAVRGRTQDRRPALLAVFGATFVGSLALCLIQTAHGSPYAFFGLPARAWEFAGAGLLALVPTPAWTRRGAVPLVSAGLGLVALAVATTTFDQDSTYPGWRALVPVVGTLLLIHAGTRRRGAGADDHDPAVADTNPISTSLAARPVQWLGRVSYSWYLWHWPFILLAVQAVGRDTLGVRGAAALVALAVGAAAHEVVENPARFNPALISSTRLTYAMGVLITALVLVLSVGVDGDAASAGTGGPTVPLTQVAASARDITCVRHVTTPDGIAYCEDGDLSSHRTVLLEGDSHANHWVPAFDRAARTEGVRLLVRWTSVCPATPIPVVSLQGPRSTTCDTYHDQTARLIRDLHPTAVVTSDTYAAWPLLIVPSSVKGEAEHAQHWAQAYEDHLASLRARGIKVGSVVDTPRNPTNPLDCLARHAADRCTTPRSEALGPLQPVADAMAAARARLGSVPTLDINHDLCDATTCKVVANGAYVYVDRDHLYRGFVLTEVPAVEAFIGQLLR